MFATLGFLLLMPLFSCQEPPGVCGTWDDMSIADAGPDAGPDATPADQGPDASAPVPFAPELEQLYMPDARIIAGAVRDVVNHGK